jgi:hypothetical protein
LVATAVAARCIRTWVASFFRLPGIRLEGSQHSRLVLASMARAAGVEIVVFIVEARGDDDDH